MEMNAILIGRKGHKFVNCRLCRPSSSSSSNWAARSESKDIFIYNERADSERKRHLLITSLGRCLIRSRVRTFFIAAPANGRASWTLART